MITGNTLYNWAKHLFPITRSIAGPGNRETLEYIKENLPQLKIKGIPSGKKVFGWIVPNEWHIKDAYIKNSKGKKIVDFKKSNLHVINYSPYTNKTLSLKDLNSNLYSLPNQPNAIPYITSYYGKKWGFCLSDNQRKELKNGKYKVVIDSKYKKGFLNYGEVIVPGKSKKEIMLSTNICHPSMGNNETSGMVVTMALAKWLLSLKERKYTYRIIFIPETIGSIAYLALNKNQLKKKVVAGFVVVCVGDNKNFSFLPSKNGNTLADKVSLYTLNKYIKKFKKYSFLDRGSDERQFCSPGIDLPFCSIMRSKYGTYPEYHTSLDNLKFISPKGLFGSFEILKKTLQILEINKIYKNIYKNLCEPKLNNYKLREPMSFKTNYDYDRTLLNVLLYADGTKDLIELATKIKTNIFTINDIAKKLVKADLLKIIRE